MSLLKRTASLCPECLGTVPASVVQVGKEVHLQRECPHHGRFAAVICSDADYYHLSVGADAAASQPRTLPLLPLASPRSDQDSMRHATGADPSPSTSCGAGCGTTCGGVENLSTCVALIEIVESCNLSCPVCFADSPRTSAVDALPFDEIRRRVDAVIERKGSIDILQLSGGEPTIHPDFSQVLEWALAHPHVGHVLLNTNGIKLTNKRFFENVAGLRAKYKKLELYLQYDGPQAAGQITLRGVDLRQVRQTVITWCQQAEIPVNLAMTVDQHNRDYLGDALQVAIDHPWVSGITWQPMFGSGRVYAGFNTDSVPGEPGHEFRWPETRRLNVADIIQAAVAQSSGRLSTADFTPLPCGDPNCHTVGYLLRQGGQLIGLSALIDLPAWQGFLQDRLNYNLADLERCGCESEPLGQLLKDLEIGPEQVLRLVIKPFMDAWTYDQHRVDRCCVHVIGAGGSLDSFCHHYAFAGQRSSR